MNMSFKKLSLGLSAFFVAACGNAGAVAETPQETVISNPRELARENSLRLMIGFITIEAENLASGVAQDSRLDSPARPIRLIDGVPHVWQTNAPSKNISEKGHDLYYKTDADGKLHTYPYGKRCEPAGREDIDYIKFSRANLKGQGYVGICVPQAAPK